MILRKMKIFHFQKEVSSLTKIENFDRFFADNMKNFQKDF